MNREFIAIGIGLAILLFAGFGVHAQLVANEQLQTAVHNGVAFLDSQENYDATDISVIAILDSIAPNYQFKQKAVQRVELLDSKHAMWRKWVLGEPILVSELSEFETNLKYNLGYARAFSCEPLTNEVIASLGGYSDNPAEEFGNYNDEHALLLLHLYAQCPNANATAPELAALTQSKVQELSAQPAAPTLDEKLERFCVLGLYGVPLTSAQRDEIYSYQQLDGGWSSDFDVSRNVTSSHATALALCALISDQQNGGLLP